LPAQAFVAAFISDFDSDNEVNRGTHSWGKAKLLDVWIISCDVAEDVQLL
jgi:hypothetical protein